MCRNIFTCCTSKRKSSASNSHQNVNTTHAEENNTVNTTSVRILRLENKTQSVSKVHYHSGKLTEFPAHWRMIPQNTRGNNTISGLLAENTRMLGEFPSTSLLSTTVPKTSTNPNKVKKTYTFDDKQDSHLPKYRTDSENRGIALILNNVKFHKEKLYRKGAEKDEKDLTDVLTKIGFRVETYSNLTSIKLRQLLVKFPKEKRKIRGDICIVVVMSHGTNNNIPGGYTEVLCSDGVGITTDDVIDYFDESKSIYLEGKPKIFIFQCCRTGMQYDVSTIKPKPSAKSNTLIAYSTIPGFASHRHSENGSLYIQTLCKILKNHADKYHIEELLKLVDSDLKKMHPEVEQVTCYENRGFSICYLNPQ